MTENLTTTGADSFVYRYLTTIEWQIVCMLMVVPTFRELVMGLFFSHHGRPFGTSKDILHVLLDTGFLMVIGLVISWIHFGRRMALQQKEHLEAMVADRTEEIRLTQQTAIETLATLSEYHDTDTGDHIRRIRAYVRILAQWLEKHSGCRDYLCQRSEYVEEISLAAILHDIGKNVVSETILSKPGKLTGEEFALMKTHTTVAGKIFKTANQLFVDRYGKDSYLALARDIAFYHHERWDGRGYPEGRAEENIPLSARIVAIADVYDALTSKRPYNRPWSHEDAVKEIIKERGTQFDPSIVDAFLANEEAFRRVRHEFAEKDRIKSGRKYGVQAKP